MGRSVSSTGELRWPERLLRPFAEVRAGEAVTALVLAATIFLVLTAYYLLKVIREPLILLGGGAEVKAYAAAGQALLLIPVLKVHAAIARRVGRMTLIAIILLFVAANLLVFAALLRAAVPVGLPFYLWVGTFNFLLVATFWSFANDVYTPEQGKRLFPIVGWGARWSACRRGPGQCAPPPPAAAAADGLRCRAARRRAGPLRLGQCAPALPSQGGRSGGAPGPASHRRGRLPGSPRGPLPAPRGVITVLTNWVTNSGEYVLDRTLVDVATAGGLGAMDAARFVGQFKAEYFWWVNVVALGAQFFLVSRVLKHLGVGGALLVLPIVAMAGAASMALVPVLALIRTAKIAEKGVDYSLETTAVNALYLVVSRDAKYKTKAVIDTFLVRSGDVCAAASIFVGTHLGLRTHAFAAINVVLTFCWLIAAWKVRSLNLARSGAHAPTSVPGGSTVPST